MRTGGKEKTERGTKIHHQEKWNSADVLSVAVVQ